MDSSQSWKLGRVCLREKRRLGESGRYRRFKRMNEERELQSNEAIRGSY